MHPLGHPQAVHLGQHEDPKEAKEEHRPETIALINRHQRPVKDHKSLKKSCPPTIDMDFGIKQTALQKQKEHEEETDQMSAGISIG